MSDKKPLHRTSAQPPERLNKLQKYKHSCCAGGVKAVSESMKHGIAEMGIVRTLKTLLKVNQQDGFDCPGCAWPDPKHRSAFEFCENGAKAVAEEATRKKVGPRFFAQHSIEELGTWSDYKLGKSGRLTHPMLLEKGASHYREISWDEGIQIVADSLRALENPDQACFYTSSL